MGKGAESDKTRLYLLATLLVIFSSLNFQHFNDQLFETKNVIFAKTAKLTQVLFAIDSSLGKAILTYQASPN